MKYPTIWESSSRPLFVRSVWLETGANAGRSHRRHFILDYEPRQRAHISQTARKCRASLKQSNSCDYQGYSADTFNDSVDYLDEYFQLGSTKLTLQSQTQRSQSPGKCPRAQRRRNWLRQCSYYAYTRRVPQDFHEVYSRRSSLQDIQSTQTNTGSNPEERLAERVLNWLDLAGKMDIFKLTDVENKESLVEMASSEAKPSMRRDSLSTVSQKRNARPQVNVTQSSHEPRRNALKRAPTTDSSAVGQRRRSGTSLSSSKQKQKQKQHQQMPNTTCQHNRPDSVKPITIIFNKEGVPVRFNRPARNIDLCAMSSSASATRRLAGQLASARLYNQAASPRHPSYTDDQTSMGRQAYHTGLHDAKKELHIFMPSLPKKGLLMSYPSTEDGASALSNAFSEFCQI